MYRTNNSSSQVISKNFLNHRWEDVDLDFTYDLYHLFNQRLFNNLLPSDPVIRFTNSKKQAGSCYCHKQRIHLSKIVIPLAESPYRFFLETLLHEMAHLLEYSQYGQKPGHGKTFKAHALEIFRQTGLEIQSRHFIDVSKNARYIGTCPSCGNKIYRFRKPRNYNVACRQCCRKYNKGRYSKRFRFRWVSL